MSFILDALRKSESERRRDAIPDITRIPLAPAKLGPPAWVVPVTTLLGLALVGLAAAWWYSAQPGTPAQRAATSQAGAQATAAAGRDDAAGSRRPGVEAPANGAARASASRPPAAPAPAAPGGERRVVPLSEVAAAPSRGADAASGPAAPAEPAPSRASPPDDDLEPAAALPRFSELLARGIALPDLSLELHVYSAVPANRFVFVNGARYGEGEALPSGQDVVRITPEGVVLSHAGTRFLLLPD